METKRPRIPFDLKELNHKGELDFEIDDFSFTEEEMKYVPYFKDMGDAYIHVDVFNAHSIVTLTLTVLGNCHLIDAHDGSTIEFPLEDSVDVVINPENEEENDIDPDEDGIYDLRGSILALLFDAIPKNYSLVPLTKIEKDNYVVMSQDEYEMLHRKSSKNVFDALDEFEIEEDEEVA